MLLGAGASIEAGVPASTSMSARIVDHVDTPANRHRGLTHALNYASGALIAHQTAQGASPYAGIDVEQLFASVQMLGNRESVEVAPFVSWSPVLDTIGPARRVSGFFDDHFRESIVGTAHGRSHYRPSDLIKEVVESVVRADSSTATFRQLEAVMLNSLVDLVSVDASQVDYLSPLLNLPGNPIEIATLNYDRAIELLAEKNGVRLDTGIGLWRGGHDWSWDRSAEVRLLKLHGSIDWTLAEAIGIGGMRESRIEPVEPSYEREKWRNSPGVVFGARGKVRAEGPFLAMLREFDDMLSRAEHLIIVGYSFRDDHINVALTRWINRAEGQRMTVVDPNFDDDPRVRRGDPTFTSALVRASRERPGNPPRPAPLKLEIVKSGASTGLATLLESSP